jgi:hypothetical protein
VGVAVGAGEELPPTAPLIEVVPVGVDVGVGEELPPTAPFIEVVPVGEDEELPPPKLPPPPPLPEETFETAVAVGVEVAVGTEETGVVVLLLFTGAVLALDGEPATDEGGAVEAPELAVEGKADPETAEVEDVGVGLATGSITWG